MSFTDGINKLIGGVHLPSFALGFAACTSLYYILPGFQLVLDELVRFVKYMVLASVVIGCLYSFYHSQQTRNIEANSVRGTSNTVTHTSAENEANVRATQLGAYYEREFKDGVGGEYKYFKIPVTKLDRTKIASGHGELPAQHDIHIQDKKNAEQQEVYVERKEVSNDFGRSINLTNFGKTEQVNLRKMRYENFVNMANHRG